MLSPVKLTPNMDAGTLANAINNNFNQIESENRTKIIKDENGVNSIIIGKNPDGSYKIKIAKPGFDVLTNTDPNNLSFDSSQNTLRVNKSYNTTVADTSFAITSTGWSSQLKLSHQIPHGLNYTPDIRGYAYVAGAGGNIPYPMSLSGKISGGNFNNSLYWFNTYLSATATNINVITTLMFYNAGTVVNDGINLTGWTSKIQVLQETANT